MALVTLETAKAHCHVTDARQDADVQRFVDQASAAILDYLQDHPDAETWTDANVPLPVQLSVLLMTNYLYRKNRGDEPPERDELGVDKGVWTEIVPLLLPYRPPTFA